MQHDTQTYYQLHTTNNQHEYDTKTDNLLDVKQATFKHLIIQYQKS